MHLKPLFLTFQYHSGTPKKHLFHQNYDRNVRYCTYTIPIVYRPCDGLVSHPGGSINTPSRFMLRKSEISAGLMDLSRLITERDIFFSLALSD